MCNWKQLPYSSLITLVGIFLLTGGELYAQCPRVKAILVDPCGDEAANEFLILDSGSGFNTGDLQISFDSNNNIFVRENNDLNINIDNFPGDTRPCRFQPGNPSLVVGCENVRVVSQDEEIPPDAIVIIQTSGDANEAIDFSYLCGNGECVYVLQNDCVRTVGAFSNYGTGTRETQIAVRNTACRNIYVYDRSLLDQDNGAYYAPEGTNLYDNRGCGVTPPVRGASIPPEFVDPGPMTGCGSVILPAITGNFLTGGERYYTGPFGTGQFFNSGAEITENMTLYIYDITAPCSPQLFFQVNIVDPVTPVLQIPAPICEEDAPIPLDPVQDGIQGNWTGPGVTGNTFHPDLTRRGIYTLTFTPLPGECAKVNTVQVEVLPSPTAAEGAALKVCDPDGSGKAAFQLTDLETQINSGGPEQVLWFEDAALSKPITQPENYISGTTQVFAILSNGVCSSPSVAVALQVDPLPAISFSEVRDPACAGDPTGSIQLTISNGASPYQLTWSEPVFNGQQNLSDLQAGTYEVTVTDQNLCRQTASATLTDPPVLELNCQKIRDVSIVGGQDGMGEISFSGGSPPYTISWSGPVSGQVQLSGTDPLTLNGLSGGDYNILFRDGQGCSVSCQLVINSPDCELKISVDTAPPTCFGETDGSIQLLSSGAVGELTYLWDPEEYNGLSSAGQLPAGHYEITVADELGCRQLVSIDLAEPPPLTMSCEIRSSPGVFGAQDGQARIRVEGGTPPYAIQWTGPAEGDLIVPFPREFLIDNLPGGIIEVVITDANGCEQFCTLNMPEGPCPNHIKADLQDESCPGSEDGFIKLQLGDLWVPPLTIDWDTDQYDGMTEISNLGPGTYFVTVTGGNSCSLSAQYEIKKGKASPDVSFSPSAGVCESDCYSYSLEFDGTPPFFAEFNIEAGGQNTILEVYSDQPGNVLVICPADYGIAAGQIQIQLLRATDANCVNDQKVESTLQVYPSPEVQYSPLLCYGESLTVNGQVYDALRPSGTEVLPGASQSGCDSTVHINLNFFPEATHLVDQTLCPGDHITINGQRYDESRPSGTETIIAPNGCDSTIQIDLSFYSPAAGYLDEVLCPGEERIINGRRYNAQNPAGMEVFPGAAATGCDSILEISLRFYEEAIGYFHPTICLGEQVVVNGQVYDESRPAGVEILPGQAYNGCDSIIMVQLSWHEDFTVALSGDSHICAGDSAELRIQINNGYGPVDLQYLANGMATNWIYGAEDGDILMVRPGESTTYSVQEIIATASPCPARILGDATVEVNQLVVDAVIESDYDGYGNSCQNESDGTLSTRIMSGQAPFQYLWQDGSTDPQRTNLAPGVYTVTVTDASGCLTDASVFLEAPPEVNMALSALPPDCSSDQSGVIIIDSISGGNSIYDFSVNNSQTGEVTQLPYLIDSLLPGTYILEVSDQFGCFALQEVRVPERPNLLINLGPDKTIRYGASVPIIGVANFQIDSLIWTPSDSLFPPDQLPTIAAPAQTTTYTLTAFDSRGCLASDQITIWVNREGVYVPTAFSPNGDGVNDLFFPYISPNVRKILEFRIFDRWGNLMHEAYNFEGNQREFGWDGTFRDKAMDPAVFIYYLRAEYQDGKRDIIKGDFALVK